MPARPWQPRAAPAQPTYPSPPAILRGSGGSGGWPRAGEQRLGCNPSGAGEAKDGGRRAEARSLPSVRGCSAKESPELAARAPRRASVCSGANSAEEPGRSAAQSAAAAACKLSPGERRRKSEEEKGRARLGRRKRSAPTLATLAHRGSSPRLSCGGQARGGGRARIGSDRLAGRELLLGARAGTKEAKSWRRRLSGCLC